MSFSYDPSLGNALSVVRLRINDRVDLGHAFEDEEINALLRTSAPLEVAAQLAHSQSAYYASKCDVRDEDVSKSMSQLSKQYAQLAKDLRAELQNDGSATGFAVGHIDPQLPELRARMGIVDRPIIVNPLDDPGGDLI